MDPTIISIEQQNEVLKANAYLSNHLFSFITSMSLKCAVQLGIPDAIHSHGKPMSLSDLATALPIHPRKATFLPQLMRVLAHSGYFTYEKIPGSKENAEGYSLTSVSKLLLKDHPFNLQPLLFFAANPDLMNPWLDLGKWFQNDDHTTFHTFSGKSFWEYLSCQPKLNKTVNDAMASDSKLLANVLMSNHHNGRFFEGLNSLVDVAGGVGEMSRAICNAYPDIKCTVLDLPHVVEGLKGTDNLTYVAGDMFKAIPPANAVLLKWILHNWSDEDAVKILKQSKKAVTSNGYAGKPRVIIIEIVIDDEQNEEDRMIREAQLFHDMQMMTIIAGKERTKREWEKLFQDAGFTGGYKIFPVLGYRSVIEVYP